MSAALAAPAHPTVDTLHRLATRLGYAGLVPFVLGAALSLMVREDAHPYVVLGLAAYATAILSFLGGIHWGLAMLARSAEPQAYVWGVVPTLVAALAVLMPAYAGLVIDGLMLIVCYLVDRKVYPRHGLASWLTLRFRLTLVATLACFLAAASA
ncbi:MAG: hypothetical protein RL375_15 [Pseudomonadota bacterium]|jgi:hypothetical protein